MQKYSSFIFDLGGVLFDIDYRRLTYSFEKLGFDNFNGFYTQLRQDSLFDDFEKGNISAADFRNRLRSFGNKNISDKEIDDAWNSILIGLPEKNVALLSNLKKDYQLFLLSNTNEIHEMAFRDMIKIQYGGFILDSIFEKIYLSHRIHLRKPDVEVFEKVVIENNLDKKATLFIDDSPQHVKGAIKAGLNGILLEKEKSIIELFEELIT